MFVPMFNCLFIRFTKVPVSSDDKVTLLLVSSALSVVLGSSAQYGYQIGVLNSPMDVCIWRKDCSLFVCFSVCLFVFPSVCLSVNGISLLNTIEHHNYNIIDKA